MRGKSKNSPCNMCNIIGNSSSSETFLLYSTKEEKEEFQRMVTKAFQFVLVVSIPMTVYFIIYVKESILFLAGESFLPATAAMIILMPTLILIGLSNITGIQILTPLGRESNVVCSVAAGAVLDFVLN